MAGIAGIIYFQLLQVNNLLSSMLGILSHRGDGKKDYYAFQRMQLGTTGSSMVFNSEETAILAFDGAIYNIAELSKELFPNSPNEKHHQQDLILKAYEKWGTAFLEKLDGEFALALFDQTKKQLILSRDRLGKKPLYWYHDAQHFVFASELKALLITGIVPQTPSADCLAAYLTMGYIPQDMSPIQGVSKLLPGHYLIFQLDGTKSIHSYWAYSTYFKQEVETDPKHLIDRLSVLIFEAVKKRIPSDQHIGCQINTGIGSIDIAALLKEMCGSDRLTTFSCGLNGLDDKDVNTSKHLAEALGTSHEEQWINSDNYLDDLVKIAWFLDEPISDLEVFSAWKIGQMASKNSPSLFLNLGAQELFGGDQNYQVDSQDGHYIQKAIKWCQPSIKRHLFPALNKFWPGAALSLLKMTRNNPWQTEYIRDTAIFDHQQISHAAPHLSELFDPVIFLQKFHNLASIKSKTSSFIYLDVKTSLSDRKALIYDRLTSAFSVECPSPFFDKHLVEYLAAVTHSGRISPKELISKLSTRQYKRNIIQENALQKWIAKSELPAIFRKLLRGTLVETGLISESWLTEQVRDITTQSQAFHQLWSVLMLEIWFRLYINHPVTQTVPTLSVYELLAEN